MASPFLASASRSSSSPASTLVIANGGAGAFGNDKDRATFESLAAERCAGASVVFTKAGADIGDLVASAIHDGATMIVAAGGDGTVNAVASALAGSDIVLGVVPLGTLNHFAKDLGIPDDVETALDVVRAANIDTIDVGVVNGRCFVNNSGLGLYPDMVAHREAHQKDGASKWPAAVAAGLRALMRYRLLGIRVVVDGATLFRRTPAVFVGNNEYVMDAPLDPRRASLDRGQLCLYIPHAQSRLRLVWFSLRALFGHLRDDHEFDVIMSDGFTIESKHAQLRVSIDGEVEIMSTPLTYAVRPKVLRVAVPPRGL